MVKRQLSGKLFWNVRLHKNYFKSLAICGIEMKHRESRYIKIYVPCYQIQESMKCSAFYKEFFLYIISSNSQNSAAVYILYFPLANVETEPLNPS